VNFKNIFLVIVGLIVSISAIAGIINKTDWKACIYIGEEAIESAETDVLSIDETAYISAAYISKGINGEYKFDVKSGKLLITSKEISAEFTVESIEAKINDNGVKLSNAPVNVEGIPYIPAIECSMLGMTASIDNVSKIVFLKRQIVDEELTEYLYDVVWSKEGARDVIYIHTSPLEMPPIPFLLSSPDRLVIDLNNIKMSSNLLEVMTIDSDIITSVRVAVNQVNVVRLVIDMKMSAGYSISYDDYDRGILKVMFNIPANEIYVLENSLYMSIKGMNEWPEPYLASTGLYYFDIENTTLIQNPIDISVGDGVLKWVKVAQYTPHIVRVAVKVKDGYSPVVTHSDDRWTIKVDFVLKLESPSIEYINDTVKVKINAKLPVSFNVFDLVDPNRIVIDVKDVYMRDYQNTEINENCALKAFRTSQYNENDGRIVLDVDQGYGYSYEIDEKSTCITLTITKSVLVGKFIMLDPGHGGDDVGCNYKEIFEKDITLDIAFILRDMLVEKGATVYLTRGDDRRVSLDERVEKCKKMVPDVFLSIHCNSHPTQEPEGIETFYYNFGKFGKTLASKIQNSLINMTGLVSRGVKSEDFFVINKTVVPAVLAEVGFLSNPDEREKLIDSSFRYLLAESFLNGLIDYFQSNEYETWSNFKTLTLDTTPSTETGQTTDSLTWLRKIIKEYNLNSSSLEYILSKDVYNAIK